MKICWDNLEGFHITKNYFRKKFHSYIEKDKCVICGDPFLARVDGKNGITDFCSISCLKKSDNNPMRNMETRKKVSITQKIRFSDPKNHPWLGRRHTKEAIEKIRKKNLGIPSWCKGKERPEICGELNPNWKGGISMEPYCFSWSNKDYREFLYDRDKDKFCWNTQCEGRGTKEYLHHINYIKKDCSCSNIIKICNACNSQANFNRDWWSSFYKEIMRRRGLC